ncbi:MAG TPA: hypothetical protein PKL31_09055 [Fulvivirga sp.]|nr:hypothetical protein [Fulvivirga sp.]
MIHKYFKKEFEEFKVIVQVNPETYAGVELTIGQNGEIEKRKLQFDSKIYDDLAEDEFKASSALEFNLYLNGIK